jgi:hypothetical protein
MKYIILKAKFELLNFLFKIKTYILNTPERFKYAWQNLKYNVKDSWRVAGDIIESMRGKEK